MQDSCLPVGKRDKNQQEKENQHSNTDSSTHTDDEQGKFAKHWELFYKPERELVTKYENQHHDKKQYGQNDGVEGCHDTGNKIVSGLADVVD